MALVWAVPVVAAAVAAAFVAVAARPLGDAVSALVDDVRALRRVRASLASVREAAADSQVLGGEYRERHPGDDGPAPTDRGEPPAPGPDHPH